MLACFAIRLDDQVVGLVQARCARMWSLPGAPHLHGMVNWDLILPRAQQQGVFDLYASLGDACRSAREKLGAKSITISLDEYVSFDDQPDVEIPEPRDHEPFARVTSAEEDEAVRSTVEDWAWDDEHQYDATFEEVEAYENDVRMAWMDRR